MDRSHAALSLALLLCDMNADAHSLEYDIICHGAGLRPLPGALDRPTFEGSEGSAQVDHVLLHATAWKPVEARRAWDRPKRLFPITLPWWDLLSRAVCGARGRLHPGDGLPASIDCQQLWDLLQQGHIDIIARQRRHAAICRMAAPGAAPLAATPRPGALPPLGLPLGLLLLGCAEFFWPRVSAKMKRRPWRSSASSCSCSCGRRRRRARARAAPPRRPWAEWACARLGRL